ncbi:DUF4260 domain-containing protein [Rheinheimera fenheensis]|uniref:DUF4260 domain-containing protein n=1 Tax=Rheinheimera fenheensis TaxID=3152295 RepID=UPI00325F1B2C
MQDSTTKRILQLEGALVLFMSILLFKDSSYSWWLFAGLFFLPDALLLGYLLSSVVGANLYNLSHSYSIPLLLGALLLRQSPQHLPLVLIWTAHIGFDRMLGYGLKLQKGFRFTHLGVIGKANSVNL